MCGFFFQKEKTENVETNEKKGSITIFSLIGYISFVCSFLKKKTYENVNTHSNYDSLDL